MAIPSSQQIESDLLQLLRNIPDSRMYCADVYTRLAERYPLLTDEEVTVPYRNSRSKFANDVQWAVQHLRQAGLLASVYEAGRGYWQLTMAADSVWPRQLVDANDLLSEMGFAGEA